MKKLLYRILILLAVFGLVITPPMITGYAELQRADSKMEIGEFSEAADYYRRTIRFLPWRQDLWEKAGMAQFFAGEFADAILFFEIAKQNRVLSADGWDWLGQSYWRTDDFESAQASWSAGLKAYPEHAKYYAHLGMAYYVQGNLYSEQWALEKWVAADGASDAAAHYRLGLLMSNSDLDGAQQEFNLTTSLNIDFDPVVETMLTALDLAILERDESTQLVFIGRGLGLVDEWRLAAQAFLQAVVADGENAEAWAWLGEAEQQLGQDGSAALDNALSFGRTNPIVRSLRGLYWMRQGRGKQALAEYLLAAEYDPDNPAWQISIGEAYIQNGDLLAALESYVRATEIKPTDATTWRLLAGFCAQYNVQVEDIGLPAAQMAVELTGDAPLALDMLGWTLSLLERYGEAQDMLQHAIRLDPGFAQAHLHLGIVALQLDDWQSARNHFQQAYEINPDDPVGIQAQMLLTQFFP